MNERPKVLLRDFRGRLIQTASIQRRIPMLVLLGLWFGFVSPAPAQLSENCLVSVLNRTAQVKPDGNWEIPNVPANMGQVRARATCVENGVTRSGQSELFTVPADGVVEVLPIPVGLVDPIPTSVTVSAPSIILTTIGTQTQLNVIAELPDGSNKNVTHSRNGTSYTSSNDGIARVSANGLVTARFGGMTVISAMYEGVIGLIRIQVVVSGDADGDGIPNDIETANGLDPNNPADGFEDADGDGLANKQELVDLGTNLRAADTDGDSVNDSDEVADGTNPTDPNSFSLARVLTAIEVTPSNFALTVNSILGETSQPLTAIGRLKNSNTINLTSISTGTHYASSDLTVCNFSAAPGRVFAGADGSCTITVTNSGFSTQAFGTVRGFTPSRLSFVDIPGFANNVDVNGSFAYVAAGAAGLQVVDATNRSAPKVVGLLDTPGNANDVVVVGTTAYVADGTAGLRIIDVANPLAPASLGALDTSGEAWDVMVVGATAYVADGSGGLQIINVSEPASPRLLGVRSLSGMAKGVAVEPSRGLAVIAAGAAGLHVVDVRNPLQPQLRGSVPTTGGDARDIAVNGNFAFVADFSRSLTTVDISDSTNPMVRASTPSANGGLLSDIALSGRFAFGADVFFVNGVPIVDVSDASNPLPSAILDFSAFRDDNGTGIAVDGNYVYLTAESGAITENGVTGNTRLYIGQYLAAADTAGISPSVAIVSPMADTTVVEGAILPVLVSASDDVTVTQVNLFVNGVEVGADSTAPYHFAVTVPSGITRITLDASATDAGGHTVQAPEVLLNVIPDPLTTVVGTVIDADGNVVVGASVNCLGVSGETDSSGSFSINDVPTVSGFVECTAAFTTSGGMVVTISFALVTPVSGGTTSIGTITLSPSKIYYSRVPLSGLSDGTVWAINGNGSGDQQVTSGERPSRSPDSRWLAFLRDNAHASRGNVYVRDLESGTETRVFANNDFVVALSWGADSNEILFDYLCSIVAINRDGTNFHGAVNGTDCFDDAPIRSPLDGAIAFHNAHVGLFLANANGSGRHFIPNTLPGDFWPAWSPDGAWISFGRSVGGQIRNYFKIHPDGSGLTQLTVNDPVGNAVLGAARSWTPDGTRLVVPGNLQGVEGLHAVATDGSGNSFVVPTTAGELIDFVGTATGRVMAPGP